MKDNLSFVEADILPYIRDGTFPIIIIVDYRFTSEVGYLRFYIFLVVDIFFQTHLRLYC